MIALIFARDKNNVIGKNNTIPWHSPHDFKRFKTLTDNTNVVMGRKTWESLPKKPLPNRTNYVISHNPDYEAPGALVFTSLEAALADCVTKDINRPTFIIGGKGLYEEATKYTDIAYITRIGVRTPHDETCVYAPALSVYNVEHSEELFAGDDQYPSAVIEKVRFRPARIPREYNQPPL